MIHSITLQRLRIFEAVCETGSFNKASQQLLLSQAAVSQQIQQLESGLGVALFDRTPKGAIPTSAAYRLQTYAQQILALASEAESQLSTLGQQAKTPLVVGATSGVSVYLLPTWLQSFQSTDPDTNLMIRTGSAEEIVNGVGQGEIDFAFFVGEATRSIIGPKVEIHPLGEIEYVVILDRDHRLNQFDQIPLSELSKTPFLNRKATSRHRIWLDQRMAELGVSLNLTAELDSPGGIKYAILSGLGIGILPLYSVERELNQRELVAKRLESGPLFRPIQMGVRDLQAFKGSPKRFLDQLIERFPDALSLRAP